jgi:hypothetical protein
MGKRFRSSLPGWRSRTIRPISNSAFTTQSAPLGTVVSIEVTLLDGRVLVAQGVDAEPSPWSHRYVNGLSEPRWKRPASGLR